MARAPAGKARIQWPPAFSCPAISTLLGQQLPVEETILPGAQNYLTFTPLGLGTFDIFCAEYCGVGHSAMNTRIHVMRPKEFD